MINFLIAKIMINLILTRKHMCHPCINDSFKNVEHNIKAILCIKIKLGGWEEVKQRTQMHMYITHVHRQ